MAVGELGFKTITLKIRPVPNRYFSSDVMMITKQAASLDISNSYALEGVQRIENFIGSENRDNIVITKLETLKSGKPSTLKFKQSMCLTPKIQRRLTWSQLAQFAPSSADLPTLAPKSIILKTSTA